ncbi:MAG: hypothetical protein AAB358_02255 [Patescibacteria group bacterium]
MRPDELFGAVRKKEATGGHQPDFKKLKEPLEKGEAAFAFCEGCGSTLRITEAGVLELAAIARNENLNQLDGRYFHAKRCVLCDDIFRDIELREIK